MGNLQEGVKVNDTKILPELSKTESVTGKDFTYDISKVSSSESGSDDLFKIFKFASDNTNVEWTMFKSQDNAFTLGTAHNESSAANYSYYGLDNPPVAQVHSHPDIGTSVSSELGSMGYAGKNQMYRPSDWSNVRRNIKNDGVQKTASYVYFPGSTRLYHVGKSGPAYIRHINKDYKRLSVGKLSN